MSSGFAALLKTSQDQTAQSEREIDLQIAARRLQLEQKRKEQEAKERKEREVEAKLRARHLEEQKKEEERKRKHAEEEEARKKEQAKREELMRHQLKYGPKKASASVAKSKVASGDNSDDDMSGSPALTREEKRQRRLAAQLRRTSGSTPSRRGHHGGRSLTSLPDGRTVRRLPGGAVDVTIVSHLADPNSGSSFQLGDYASAKERLTAMPAMLMKLNTVKRDTRTVDDLVTERQKNKQKVLAGDEAKNYSNWFGKKKKEEDSPVSKLASQQSNVLSAFPSTTSSRAASASPSLSPAPSGPVLKRKMPTSISSSKSLPTLTNTARSSAPIIAPRQVAGSKSSVKSKRPASPPLGLPLAKRRNYQSSSAKPIPRPSALRSSTHRRDADYDDDVSDDDSGEKGMDKVSEVIQDLFRRGRAPLHEMSDDYDTDDMEAGIEDLVKEERMSSRIAKKEDAEALLQELEHERQKKFKKVSKLNRKT